MRAASDIADWWDEQHRISKKILDEFVEDHPNWWGIFVATATATAMELGAGMVDVLRLGEGVAKGGWRGYGEDALRLLQLAPALGKLGKLGSELAHARLARVLADPGGGICTWMAATKALRQAGVRAFVTVEDLAKAMGLKIPAAQLPAKWVHEMTPVLRRLGARVTELGTPRTWEEVVAATRRGKEAVLFSVEWKDIGQAGKEVVKGHTLYAFRDIANNVRIADRTGKVVRSLAELERLVPGYGKIGSATVYGTMARVEGATIKLLPAGTGVLAMEVKAQLLVDPETAAQTLEVRKQAEHSPPPSSVFHTVVRGESLSRIAQHYYGDMHKWPVLYGANRKTVGSNPNLIYPGQRLVIPPLPRVSAVRRAHRR
jgi:LysM repeat protein